MFSAFSVLCCADSSCESRLTSFGTNLLAAFLQLITCPLVIGFIWSIIWGVLFIQIARKWFISSIDNRYSSVDCCPCARW
uniref:Frizzled domain-containing protein n=1 Tax=Heterorhabditis bacteriophora TaxID=37862 RepID=A0A1I7XIL8_HETBA